jgi:hypothetical protein
LRELTGRTFGLRLADDIEWDVKAKELSSVHGQGQREALKSIQDEGLGGGEVYSGDGYPSGPEEARDWVSQQNYIANVLEHTGMTNCSPVSTPIPTNAKAMADDPVNNETLHSIVIEGREVSYKSVVGSLMYAMLATRPDLAFAVGFLGRYAANPKQYHWSIAKRCL